MRPITLHRRVGRNSLVTKMRACMRVVCRPSLFPSFLLSLATSLAMPTNTRAPTRESRRQLYLDRPLDWPAATDLQEEENRECLSRTAVYVQHHNTPVSCSSVLLLFVSLPRPQKRVTDGPVSPLAGAHIPRSTFVIPTPEAAELRTWTLFCCGPLILPRQWLRLPQAQERGPV